LFWSNYFMWILSVILWFRFRLKTFLNYTFITLNFSLFVVSNMNQFLLTLIYVWCAHTNHSWLVLQIFCCYFEQSNRLWRKINWLVWCYSLLTTRKTLYFKSIKLSFDICTSDNWRIHNYLLQTRSILRRVIC
jgi:hypothetical protein